MTGTPASREQHLLTVGKLEHNAAAAEAIMFGAFTVITGLEPKLARAIFYALDSFPGKRNLLQRVCEGRTDIQDMEFVRDIIAGAETANNQRKQVAHGLLSFVGAVRVWSPKNQPEPRMPSQEWHNDLLNKSEAAGGKAKAAFEALCRKRTVPPKIDFE